MTTDIDVVESGFLSDIFRGEKKKRYHKIQTVFIFSRFVCVFVFVLCFAVIWSFESMTKHCIRFAIVKMLW